MTEEKIMEKVRKLLAKAERAGSQHEADAFTAKATELMLRYAIDEALLQQSGKSEEKIVVRDVYVKGYAKAKLSLMFRVAEGLGLKAVQYSNNRSKGWAEGRGQVVGWESDVEAFEALFASLQMQATTEVERAFKKYQREGGEVHGRAYKQSFLIGFASEVGTRLLRQRQTTVQQADQQQPGSAVALFDRKKAVDNYYAKLYPQLGKGRGPSTSTYSGYYSGKDAGSRANLGGTSVSNGGRKAIGR